MSRAFVKESDGADGDELAELQVSPHRNLVTAEGMVQIEQNVERLIVGCAGRTLLDAQPTIARPSSASSATCVTGRNGCVARSSCRPQCRAARRGSARS